MPLKILCDFDGTISIADATDSIFERFAPSWFEIETLMNEGKIDPAQCMRREVELMDVSLRELDAALDEIEIDPTFPAFAGFCERAGISLTVVSDGVDYFIRRILKNAGVGHLPVRANRLVQLSERKFTLTHPYSVGECESGAGTCKCRRAAAERPSYRTVLIGDGRSDFCLSQKADFVFAKKSLLQHTRSKGIVAFEYQSFADVQAVFQRWPLRWPSQAPFSSAPVEAAA